MEIVQGLSHHEDLLGGDPYNVNAWVAYMDEIDDLIKEKEKENETSRGRDRDSGSSSDDGKLRKQKAASATTASASNHSLPLPLPALVRLRDTVGKRSVQLLPRSYKLWKLHWEFVVSHHEHLGGPSTVLGCFERAMVTLHKFPRAWMAYLEFAHNAMPPPITTTTIFLQEEQEENEKENVHLETTNLETTNLATATTTRAANVFVHPTQLRHLVNRALEAIPVTQHDKLWPVLLKYYQSNSNSNSKNATFSSYIPKETKLSVLRRYVQYNPAATKEIADFLADELGQWGEAALMYVDLLNHDDVRESGSGGAIGSGSGGASSATARSTAAQRKDLWMSLAKICTRHPVEDEIGLDFEAIVRAILTNSNNNNNNNNSRNGSGTGSGALRYLPKEMEGVLWSQLADAWIRRGEFQLARSVYEEAIESVSRVRDFTILMDAYLQFEEGLLEATMEQQADLMDEDEDDDEYGNGEQPLEAVDENDWDILLPQHNHNNNSNNNHKDDGTNSRSASAAASMSDLELALARAEDLTARRPILLNGVLLRQNPDDVGEWLKRARMYRTSGQIHQAAAALEEGLKTVKARRAVGGNPNQMVVELVTIYEVHCKDVAKARNLLDRICNQYAYEFKNVDDLAECFVTRVELELRQESWDDALDIIRASVVLPPAAPRWTRGLPRSRRLWDLLLDLEESLGTVQTTKDAYGRAMDQKVATPLHILNFATFLKEQKYFEESFSAYERGIELFRFPAAKLIWKAYMDSFLKRYGGTKVERTRDLFQRCLEVCPPEESTEFFLSNGRFEEEHGLTKRALGVYKQMCQTVPSEQKYTAYQLFIAKTAQYLGQTATRDIYQNAVQDLQDEVAARLCLEFAAMETSLREIDRARAVLAYGAQMADPRRNEGYWTTWNEFEISHGNEETFREMLRIKRSVEASFSTVNYNAAEMSGTDAKATAALSNEEAMRMIAQREGMDLNLNGNGTGTNAGTTTISGFVASSSNNNNNNSNSGNKRSAQAASLESMEEKVAKLRKATGAALANETAAGGAGADKDKDADEIDIDELVDELEGDAADADEIDIDIDDEGDEDEDEDEEKNEDEATKPSPTKNTIRDVSTKAVPAAVFGGLVKNNS